LQCDFREVWSVEESVVEEWQTAPGSQDPLRILELMMMMMMMMIQ